MMQADPLFLDRGPGLGGEARLEQGSWLDVAGRGRQAGSSGHSSDSGVLARR